LVDVKITGKTIKEVVVDYDYSTIYGEWTSYGILDKDSIVYIVAVYNDKLSRDKEIRNSISKDWKSGE